MRTIAGILPTTGGSVQFAGESITGLPPYCIAYRGLAYVPQGRGIFPKLTVEENLTIGTRAQRLRGARIPEVIYNYFPILAERSDQLGGTLSGGQQQQLAIGRAMCGNPKILILDEPSEGVQPNIVQQIGTFLREIVANGDMSVLLVEQNLELGLKASDRCIVLEKGRVVHEALPAAFEDQALLSSFLSI
jgi:ABC-type branched-subunit amino acid transport system ATPase component